MNSEFDKENVKSIVKEWILKINENEEIEEDIIAINFGIFEPYGIELIGSKEYDSEDDDWACEGDFVPIERTCAELNIDSEIEWEEVLDNMVEILTELADELNDIDLLKVQHITTGFCDGDLVVIR